MMYKLAVAAVIANRGKVLIAKRKPQDMLPPIWEFPGGRVEDPNDLEGELKREILEELGIDIKIQFLLEAYTMERNSEPYLLLNYLCFPVDKDPEIQLSDHSEVRWVGLEELSKLLDHPKQQGVIMKLVKIIMFFSSEE